MNDNNQSLNLKIYDIEKKQIVSESINEVIKEMVAAQMPISFELEALKAQAIITRTYIVRKSRLSGGEGCNKHDADLCRDEHCGEWFTIDQMKDAWRNDFDSNWNKLETAVTSTNDLIITINNKPIEPRFHSTCGGATENAENIEGNKTLYLRKVLCDYCVDSPYYKESLEMTLEEIEEKLNIGTTKAFSEKGSIIEGIIEDVIRDDAGRIKSIKFGGRHFKGLDVMNFIGLNSTRFGWKPIAFRIEMQGKGDGLGMCQYGANGMAKQGKTSEEILKYYFTGIQIKKFEKPSINQPLRGKIILLDPGHGGDNMEDVSGPVLGLREKDVNLSISLRLAKLLREVGAEVHETRTKDVYVSLSKRASIANKVRPDFFISIHQNFFANPNISGSEIYYYRGDREGETLGSFILRELSLALGTAPRGTKIADFYLLREIRTSVIQVEVGFITNPEEEKMMALEEFSEKSALAILKGLIRYYSYE